MMEVKDSRCCLGVFVVENKVFLYYYLPSSSTSIYLDESTDGFIFNKTAKKIKIFSIKDKAESFNKCRFFRISLVDSKYYLTYLLQLVKREQLFVASSNNLNTFRKIGPVGKTSQGGIVLPFKDKNHFLLLKGGKDIRLAKSLDLKKWKVGKEPLIKTHSPNHSYEIGNIFFSDSNFEVVFFEKVKVGDNCCYLLKSLSLNKNQPDTLPPQNYRLIWRMPEELFKEELKPIGVIEFKQALISYWLNKKGNAVFAVSHQALWQVKKQKFLGRVLLERVVNNPILKPLARRFWESRAVFNPAALYEDGKVHLIYRAIGDSETSVLGYAQSRDGITIDYRSSQPVYLPTQPFELPQAFPLPQSAFASGGGGYGGCEDPRLVKIDNRVYMTYVAHNGRNLPRVALTSIDIEDFKNQRWNWEKPVLISPPGVVDKNACLLPEKIDNKYVIFHRIFPDILIDFLDDLNFDGKTNWLKGEYKISPRKYSWDSRKVGVGAPPIKTKDGWLTIYQAVGDQDPGRYKMGAMLLSLSDPTKVLYRTDEPILSPDMDYENEGYKAGVIYPCGTVKIEDDLIVYYGGADTVVCAAKTNLNTFLKNLKAGTRLTLEEVKCLA